MTKRALLVLEDGSVYEGFSFGAEADALGADAITGIRFSTSFVMQGAAEFLVYGTAVKVVGS